MSDEPTEQEMTLLAKSLFALWAHTVVEAHDLVWESLTKLARERWYAVAAAVHVRYADQIATLTRERDEARDEAARLRGEVEHETTVARNLCDENDRLKRDIAALRGDLDRLRYPLETVTMPAGDDVDREVFAEMLYHLWFQSAPTMWFDATPAVRERVLQVADQILARYYVRLGATGVPPVRNYTCEISPLDDATPGKVRAATKAVFSRHVRRHHYLTRRERVALAILPELLYLVPRHREFPDVVRQALSLADAFVATTQQPPAEPPKEPTVEGSHDHDSD